MVGIVVCADLCNLRFCCFPFFCISALFPWLTYPSPCAGNGVGDEGAKAVAEVRLLLWRRGWSALPQLGEGRTWVDRQGPGRQPGDEAGSGPICC